MTTPVLTVLEPYASAIIHGPKRVENRTWRPPAWLIGKDLLVHAGKSDRMLRDQRIVDAVGLLWPGMPRCFGPAHATGIWLANLGKVIGIVRVVDCVILDDIRDEYDLPCFRNWASGPRCWILDDPRPVELVPLTGRQGVWMTDAEIVVIKE